MNSKINMKYIAIGAFALMSNAAIAQRANIKDRAHEIHENRSLRPSAQPPSNSGTRPTVRRPDPVNRNPSTSQAYNNPPARNNSMLFGNEGRLNRNNPPAASPAPSTSRGSYNSGSTSRYNNGYNSRYNNGYNNRYYNNGYNHNYYGAPRYRYYYGGGYHQYPHYYRPFSAPSFGVTINVLPRGYHRFRYNHSYYYYSAGNFYSPYNGYYQLILPPLGARIPVLPYGAYPVVINDLNYYEYNGTYYQPYGSSSYEVVGQNGYLSSDLPPANDEGDIISDASIQKEAVVLSELPQNFKTVTLNNIIYYVSSSGEYYVKNIDEKGTVSYTAVALEATGN